MSRRSRGIRDQLSAIPYSRPAMLQFLRMTWWVSDGAACAQVPSFRYDWRNAKAGQSGSFQTALEKLSKSIRVRSSMPCQSGLSSCAKWVLLPSGETSPSILTPFVPASVILSAVTDLSKRVFQVKRAHYRPANRLDRELPP